MNRPTRFYSNRQEKAVAKVVGGRQTPNSGATDFLKGDVASDTWLYECKTCTTEKSQFTIKKDWLEKNKEEAFSMGKENSALVFDFGDGKRYYIIDERTFKRLLEVYDG